MTSLRRFIAGSGAERSAALLALVMAPLVKLSLRGAGYRRTARYLGRVALKPVPGLDGAVERGVAAHGAMRRLPFEMTCLERSLVVWWLLGGDATVSIQFGVAPGKAGDPPTFHAWVEVAGQPIGDGAEDIDSFLPLTPRQTPELGRFE